MSHHPPNAPQAKNIGRRLSLSRDGAALSREGAPDGRVVDDDEFAGIRMENLPELGIRGDLLHHGKNIDSIKE